MSDEELRENHEAVAHTGWSLDGRWDKSHLSEEIRRRKTKKDEEERTRQAIRLKARYRDMAFEELKSLFELAKDHGGRSSRYEIALMSEELGRRAQESREAQADLARIRLRHLRIQSVAALLAALAAILGFLTPLGPWLRTAVSDLLQAVWGP